MPYFRDEEREIVVIIVVNLTISITSIRYYIIGERITTNNIQINEESINHLNSVPFNHRLQG